MSVWSRNHNDLAKLAKDLQQRNHRIKSNAAKRTRVTNIVGHPAKNVQLESLSKSTTVLTTENSSEKESTDVHESEKNSENIHKSQDVLFCSDTFVDNKSVLLPEKTDSRNVKDRDSNTDDAGQVKDGKSANNMPKKVFDILQGRSENCSRPKLMGKGENKLEQLLQDLTSGDKEGAKHRHVKKTIESIMALKAESKANNCSVEEKVDDSVKDSTELDKIEPEDERHLPTKTDSCVGEKYLSTTNEDNVDTKYLSTINEESVDTKNVNCVLPNSDDNVQQLRTISSVVNPFSNINSSENPEVNQNSTNACLDKFVGSASVIENNEESILASRDNSEIILQQDAKLTNGEHFEQFSLTQKHSLDENRNCRETFSLLNFKIKNNTSLATQTDYPCIESCSVCPTNLSKIQDSLENNGFHHQSYPLDQNGQHKWIQDEYNKALLKSQEQQQYVVVKSPTSCSSSSGIADINIVVKNGSSLNNESLSTDQGLELTSSVPDLKQFVISSSTEKPVIVSEGIEKSRDNKVLIDESDLKELMADLRFLYVSLSQQKQLESEERHGIQESTEDSYDHLKYKKKKKKHKAPKRKAHLKDKGFEGDLEESIMDGLDSYQELDKEFDKVLAEMKPYVLKLPQKTDRQKCAVWIKKLCEPQTSGITGRKNRNMYTQLMLHMLKRGNLEGPFDKKPEEGPLQTLPPYMSIYFDESVDTKRSRTFDDDKVPDWVNGELMESAGSSIFRKSTLDQPAATSTWLSSSSSHEIKQRPHSSMGLSLDKDSSLSPPRRNYLGREEKCVAFSADDLSVPIHNFSPIHNRQKPVGERKRQQPISPFERQNKGEDTDWSKPFISSFSTNQSLPRGTTFQEDTVGPSTDREIELRAKMIEAKYHEEKLKLQQKHDAAVQKILERKNAEIEDVKSHYRGKAQDLEETITKLERKIHSLVKESQVLRETKDKQITELKKLIDETAAAKKAEFDKKLHDAQSEFEQEKFEMQKQHTKNIQEILDDTNSRLQRMEREYIQQTESTGAVIKELEMRVQQLTEEVEKTVKQKVSLEQHVADLETNNSKLKEEVSELRDRLLQQERDHQNTIAGHEHEMRTLKHKTEASLEYLKQEQTMSAAKAMDTIEDLQQQLEHTKKLLKDTEEQRQRQIRELEQVHQQDKLHTENLHDKQVHSMKKEMEQLEQDAQKKINKLEQLVQDKDKENIKLQEQIHDQAVQSEKALQEFKSQVEKNQIKVYDGMKKQMEQVETDLNKSKQLREKQSKEFRKQLDEQMYKHDRELQELKMMFDTEKAQLLRDFHIQKEYMTSEHEKDLDTLKEMHQKEMQELETRLGTRHEKDSKTISEFEAQIRELREELVQSNQLRKQQLVELGLLREEEKQKMQRDHEADISRLRSELEQQRLELQKTHSTEMENMLEKTNQRLKDIEKEYSERGQKSAETIAELHATINQLQEEKKRLQESKDRMMSDVSGQTEEVRKALKKQYSSTLASLQKELDNHRQRTRSLERQLQKEESEHEAKVTRLKLSYEDKLRGLIPVEVRQELEETIESLRSQVNSLQQRAAILQEELDLRLRNTLGPFGSRTSSPIKSSV